MRQIRLKNPGRGFNTRLEKLLPGILLGLLAAQATSAKPTQVPLESAFAVEPNIMILLDNSSSMSSNSLPDIDGLSRTRFEVVKNAFTGLIEQSENVRFCLTVFEGATDDGGWQANGGAMTSAMQCSSETNAAGTGGLDKLVQEIDRLPVITASTPLAEAYYDITRYFKGQPAYFGDYVFPDPVQYRCQTNSVIVLTDGEPQLDWDRKEKDTPIDLASEAGNYGAADNPGDPLNEQLKYQARSLPNWDNTPANGTRDTRDAGTGLFPALSDGSCGTTAACDPGIPGASYTLFLDDLALFGLQKDLDASLGEPDDHEIQNLKTHTIGLEINTQMLQDAADYGDGMFMEINSAPELAEALETAMITSVERQGRGATATQSGIKLDADGHSSLYITRYDTRDWSGDLEKVQLEEQADHTLNARIVWSAAEQLDARADPVNERLIFTPNQALSGLSDFNSDGLPGSMSDALLAKIKKPDSAGLYTTAKNVVDYLRGKQTLNAEQYRPRRSLMGDLIHSRATYVKNRDFGYPDSDYAEYLLTNAQRKAMLYVGGNDGMLHAFDEQTGEELFAYIPNSLLKQLNHYRSNTYKGNHLYYVDGETTIVDVRLDNDGEFDWATVLASPLGAGKIGLFLLNISKPAATADQLRTELFKWEIDNKTLNAGSHVFKRMGYMINPVKLVRFRIPEGDNTFHDKWVVISGNGIHSSFNDQGKKIIGAATVLVIDLDSGELITELVVDNGFSDQIRSTTGTAAYTKFTDGNGVTSVAAVDTNHNSYIDRVYAADLKGKLWRFNYDDAGSISADDNAYIRANLKVAYTTAGGIPGPIFAATGGRHPRPFTGSYAQAITAELTVTTAPAAAETRDGEMIFFGTGQFFDFTHLLDNVNNKVQTMYAFWDKGGWNSNSAPNTRADLQEQVIVESTIDGEKLRTLPNIEAIDYKSKRGWFMDMPTHGERITRKAVGLFEHMAFFSRSPVSQSDRCIAGFDGWSMIAKKDTATPIAVTLADDSESTSNYLGTRHTGDSIHDPIFVELSDGQFLGPLVIDSSEPGSNVTSTRQIQKDYSRASWKRLELQ